MHTLDTHESKPLQSRVWIGKIILVALHVVGVIGLSLPEYRDLFLELTPFHLLGTMVLILV